MPTHGKRHRKNYEEQKQLRRARSQAKRHRKKRVRRKDWMPASIDDLDGLYDIDSPGSEPVMPRGERERRQAFVDAALSALRETDAGLPTDVLGEQGTVIEVSSSMCRVEVNSQILVCAIRGSLSAEDTGYTNVIAVGDEVIVSQSNAGQGIVETVLPRQSILARQDVFYSHLKQVIVANADQLLIVASWRDPKLWPELIDRYWIAAERSRLHPLICVNKIDLAEDIAACRAEVKPYLDLGYRVLFTSALTGQGIDRLANALRGQVTVLAGMSGVGKSTLLNAVQPGLALRTGVVSEHSHTGRHTTAQVTLHKLEAGGLIVDTPGIREFGLSGLLRKDLIRFYPEIAAVEGHCRFGDCSHSREPGCAVKAALRERNISKARFKSYRSIYAALPESQAQEREQALGRAWR